MIAVDTILEYLAYTKKIFIFENDSQWPKDDFNLNWEKKNLKVQTSGFFLTQIKKRLVITHRSRFLFLCHLMKVNIS